MPVPIMESDSEDGPAVAQSRVRRPSAKISDPNNSAQHDILSHQTASERARDNTTDREKSVEIESGPAAPSGIRRISTKRSARDANLSGDDENHPAASEQSDSADNRKDVTERSKKAPKQKKPRRARGAADENDEVDENGILVDIDVQDVSDTEQPAKLTNVQKTADVHAFFYIDPDDKKYAICKECARSKKKRRVVVDPSTRRIHLAAYHKPAYHKWCHDNKFTSKLRDDVIARKADESKQAQKQSMLDQHLKEKKKEVIVKYTDELFKEAAVEWLVSTNQPIDALNHEKFRQMIDIASRAKDGVRIPGPKATRQAIIDLFKTNLKNLKKRLAFNKTTSPAVSGEVALTCDAWQASNADGYFAVTGHWIEEQVKGIWVKRTALLGFTRLSNAHNGQRLGQALYKIVRRVGILRKAGFVTCDGAKNNGTMMFWFAKHVVEDTGRTDYYANKRHLFCHAHIINLGTQSLISAHSKSKHYNPAEHDTNLVGDAKANGQRDEIGILRTICVKARSSAKRKEKVRKLQRDILTFLLDMAVRWSSTYAMLDRAYTLQDVNE